MLQISIKTYEFFPGWVYPVVTHWAWTEVGWMQSIHCNGTINVTENVHCFSYKDFAGGGVVHVFGGVCALVGCYFVGPRKGRFTDDGKPAQMAGHSVPLSALGGFILLFGFLAFNGGSLVCNNI